MKKKIILISGDPNSINSELIYKSWKKLSKKIRKNIFLISNYNLVNDQLKKLNYKIPLKLIKDVHEFKKTDALKVVNVDINYRNPFKVSHTASSKFIIQSLNLAHNLALDRRIAGIINCPIDKRLLKKKEIGVTEFLASKCLVDQDTEVMLIKNDNLIVSPVTTHLDIKSVSKKIKKTLILNKIKIIHKWFLKIYKKKPKIAVLGLNPHNAELRKNSEEKKKIIPAIKILKKLKINVNGPLVADTLFIKNYKNYDVIVGMYHDQVLTPFKTLYKYDAINLTLGLKYFRLSPDHGVAKDQILKKKSDPTSLIRCIEYLQNINT